MVINILFYDDFWDIPMRGIARTSSSILAFRARPIDKEPFEIRGRAGVYAKILCFQCDERVIHLFEEKDAIFRQWRARFDAGLADKMTHPLYTDPKYQDISRQIDMAFDTLKLPIRENAGLMRIESANYVFECTNGKGAS